MFTVVSSDNEVSLPAAEELRELVRKQATELVPPMAAMKAIKVADDPTATAAQIATVISSDIRLTAQLLALANSAAFAPVQPLTEIRAAISRLGIKRVRNLLLATALGSVMKQMPIDVEWANEVIHHHGRLTACVSSRLVGLMPVGLQGEEFAAGLVHDIGRLALFSLLGEAALAVDNLTFDELGDPRVNETDALGVTHTEVGALLLETIGFPLSLVEVVSCHHEPEIAERNPTLVAIVALADQIANQLQRDQGAFRIGPAELRHLKLLCSLNEWELEWTRNAIEESDMESLIDEARCLFET